MRLYSWLFFIFTEFSYIKFIKEKRSKKNMWSASSSINDDFQKGKLTLKEAIEKHATFFTKKL